MTDFRDKVDRIHEEQRRRAMLNDDRRYPVSKNDLLVRLRTNRDAHNREYQEAMAEYRKAAIGALSEQLAKARDGQDFTLKFNLTVPVSYTKSYDTAIGLLEMTKVDTIDITAGDYHCYIEDEWDWKGHFKMSVSSYNNGR